MFLSILFFVQHFGQREFFLNVNKFESSHYYFYSTCGSGRSCRRALVILLSFVTAAKSVHK